MDETPQDQPHHQADAKKTWRWKGLSITVLVILLGALCNSLIKLPYYVLAPGDALPVKNYINLPADKSKGQNGKVLLATVSLIQASPLDFVLAKLSSGDDIDGKKAVLGPSTTQSQYLQENQAAMDDSQQVAITVALTRAGYTVKQLGDGAQVTAVGPNTPAAGKLNPGDTITSINGQSVATADEAVALVRGLNVGGVVHLQVKNTRNTARSVDLTLAARPDNAKAYIGVALSTLNPHLDTPFPVNFKKTDIGGPSAGLAFTLTLLDELTPGQLTGGATVAATGEILADGTVGPVGGVKQKTVAVENAGAKIFLVPSDEYADAKKQADKKLTVIKVDTLDQAIQALATHGGDASGIPAQPQSAVGS